MGCQWCLRSSSTPWLQGSWEKSALIPFLPSICLIMIASAQWLSRSAKHTHGQSIVLFFSNIVEVAPSLEGWWRQVNDIMFIFKVQLLINILTSWMLTCALETMFLLRLYPMHPLVLCILYVGQHVVKQYIIGWLFAFNLQRSYGFLPRI